MRPTCSVYVDTGYLLASAATRRTGTSLRSGIFVDYATLIAALVDAAETRSGLPILRVYWYDSARNGVPDAQQERIGELSKVKLRLGRFGVNGEQKGVDLRIGLDLVAHARSNASDVFFLVSGDDDLTEAVEEAQAHGVQVLLLTVPTNDGKPHGVSRHLIRASDGLDFFDGAAVDAAVMKIDRQPPPVVVTDPVSVPKPAHRPGPKPGPRVPTPLDVASTAQAPAPVRPANVLVYSGTTGSGSTVQPEYVMAGEETELIDEVVSRVLASLEASSTPEDKLSLQRTRPNIPPDIDRALLLDASDAMGHHDLDEGIRYRLRARFWEKYDEQ
ncbi:NYN domain-containing protein [Rhodococcus sp. RS1C4]|nr:MULTISPECIES: NYN domain-containing protein [Rhodococcus]OZC52765.1 NYN domain-containing protein [Rhodococcus sp. RS1C4]OZD14733.1 NYN domain-containing protein [Rhodococcus sp. 06-156-4C]OZD20192.1 NYN domain-containing protein [Rhodococcus sp. 06-156-4a]OZD22505.1 NYN domain-containing protein [Rhodococcus sp. 06-156-3C]OZD26209.1 NYN domain-containing protein [Rhodococcus sp. 06-156-3b]